MLYLEGSPTLNIRVVWKLTSDIIYDTKINYADIVSVLAVSSKHVISFFSKSVPSTSEE